MDQRHIRMCHRAVAWTSNVTYVCAIRLRGLKNKNGMAFGNFLVGICTNHPKDMVKREDLADFQALTLSPPAIFSAKCKSFFFFFRKFIASLIFMLEIYIKRPFFLEKTELFFHIGVKKLQNQVRNEIFRQMSPTSTLTLDVPVRPMDAKGLKND